MKLYTYIFYITLLILTSTKIKSQEIPPTINYTPEIYNAENQNWGISQTKNDFIYAANNKGLLEFNGSAWNLYQSPNNSIIRSVTVINGRIYTGCYMDFGYWEKDKSGSLKYTSISSNKKIQLLEDEEFWTILQLDEWILFQSLNRIYIYNSIEKSFKIIESKSVLQKIFKVNNTIYYQKLNNGLYKIEKGTSELVCSNSILKNNIIVGIYKHNKSVLIFTQKKGFYKLKENKLVKWETPSDELLSKISIYSSIETTENKFILGTISHGLFEIDHQGKVITTVDQEKGLNNNTVLNIFEDNDKNIWVGLDNGVSCLNLNSAFKVYFDKNGKLGTTYASIQYNNHLYLGTNQGLFLKNTTADENFRLIQGTEGQVWNLQVIDKKLFCGHNQGTFIINNDEASLISSIPGTWKLELLPNRKDTMIQGNYNGFCILKKENNQWKYSHKIDGFNISSRYFECLDNNKILVSHEQKGIYELHLNSDLTKFSKTVINTKLQGEKSSIVKYQDAFLYFYKKGAYKFNPKKHIFTFDSIFSHSLTKNERYISGKLVNNNNQKLWAFTGENIIFFSPGKLNSALDVTKIFLPVELRKDNIGFENISPLNDNKYLLGTSFGFIIIDTKKLYKKKEKIKLTQITKRKLNNHKTIVSLEKNNIFEYEYNNIDFSFSVPNYDKFTEIEYQYILEDRHKHWSEWSKESSASFKNLPYGNYTFRARAKVGNQQSENEIIYSFKIARPWFLSNKMIGIYFLVFIGFIFIVHTIYKQYYKKQKKQYLDKKQREFEHTQLENEKEIMKLRNDKLRNDIEAKNRELAASTMSIIKKNEFLNSIKKELSEFKNNDLIKPVIKIIDKNLNNNSDWKLFQEAFNNADKDFLTKIKDKYPELTPNDLRLCAYLRLNLSSKEIAPLLNISHKSVEIKRYRLRKKMGLVKKDNLIHHILEI